MSALADELRFRASPLPTLLKAAARAAGGNAGETLLLLDRTLQDTGDWKASLDLLPERLPQDCAWELQNALAVLGGYDLETQLAALSEAQKALTKAAGDLQADMQTKGRVYRAAGLSVGLMLALLLW